MKDSVKDTQIIVRCYSADKAWYEEAAVLAGKKLSAWVYDTLNRELDTSLGSVLGVEMSTEELASLGERATEAGVSLVDYVKSCCISTVSRPPRTSESVAAPKPSVAPSISSKRNYTGATALMFHKKQYEYLLEDGTPRWTTEAP